MVALHSLAINISHFLVIVFFIVCALIILWLAIKRFAGVLSAVKSMGLRISAGKNISGVMIGSFLHFRIYSHASDEGHIVVFGSSGSGKTSSVLIPTLRAWHDGTLFALDISGDISRNVHRPDQIIFAPLEKGSVAYNVFALVDNPPILLSGQWCSPEELRNARIEELEKIVFLLLPEQAESDGGKYFEAGGRDILKASFIAFYFTDMDFPDICRVIYQSGYRKLFKMIDDTGNEDAIGIINQYENLDEKWISGSYQEAVKAVSIFTKYHIANSFHRSRFGEYVLSPASLEKHSVIMSIPGEYLEIYTAMLSLVSSQVLGYLMTRTAESVPETFDNNNILVALDEFGSLKNITDMADPLREIRKHRARIMLVLQSLTRLDANYGDKVREDMINNINTQIVCRLNDAETENYYSKKSGLSSPNMRLRLLYHSCDKPEAKYRPQDFERLRKHTICFKGGYTIKLRQRPYYKDKQSL